MKNPPLGPEFFRRDTVDVAVDLLGQILIHRTASQTYLGRIVETEAYLGLEDPACHSFHGKTTERTWPFYLEGGHIYIYMIYGVHYCLNFITGDMKTPEAVLIRAVEPLYGVEAMAENRNLPFSESNIKKLCNGPGKLCQAFAIDKSENGKLTNSAGIGVLKGETVSKLDIVARPRIGLNPGQDSSSWPLRFYIEYNGFISRP
jgi:DNA-3-methyladenine glycosylase